MFGTVAKVKFKPGKLKEMMDDLDRDASERDPGTVAVLVFQSTDDPDVAFMVAVAESEEAYRANANRPETDARFRMMMEYMETEPEWNDGHVIYSDLPG
jgi:quinol monooxygenase YgiN